MRSSRRRDRRLRLTGVLGLVVASVIALASPIVASATIFEAPPEPIVSTGTNPGDPSDYGTTWREGWGNTPLADFQIAIPQPDAELGEPAIYGAFYAVGRPGSIPTTIAVGDWPSCYNAILVGKDSWSLQVDLPAEHAYPGPLTVPGWTPPPGAVLARPYEGPYAVSFQYFASGVTDAWGTNFTFGLDMTPPLKVTGLTARPGYSAPPVSGVLTQSRVFLTWDQGVVYDSLSGTGYFELFIDGEPYPVNEGSQESRRVYDGLEHYPGYGFSMYSRRGMTIEDLPAGVHTLQVRAVDRATNEGPLSDPVTIQVDPDLPVIDITAPKVSGQPMGARPVFAADVTDLGGVAEVRFYVDGVLRATKLAPPYTAPVDLSAFGDGTTHTLRVEADDIGGRTNSAAKQFVIDKIPRVSIIAPDADGAVMSAPSQVSALIRDVAGIESVTFRIDGAVIDTFTPASIDTTQLVAASIAPVSAGAHTFEVTAVSTSGGSVVTSRTFTADPTKRISTLDFGPPTGLAQGLSGMSTTNPYTPSDPATFWRELWGNSVFPNFTIETPSFVAPDQVELLYAVDRNAMSQIDPEFPATFDRSSNWQGVDDELRIDQRGLVEARPALSGLTLFNGLATDSVEGIWFWHVLFQDKDGNTVGPYDLQYGIDVTRPAKVEGVQVFDSKESNTPALGWIDQSRGVIRWDNSQQDSLSGTAYYRIYVDGACVVPGESAPGASILDPETGPAGVPWYREGRAQESLTLETFGPGLHTVQIAAVDRAGNEGVLSDPLLVRMISTPAITIQSPSKVNEILATPTPLRALVTDAAGIQDVVFSIDGVPVRTFVPSVAGAKSIQCSFFEALTTGPHTVLVTARSISGTTQMASRTLIVDATLPPVIPPPSGGGSDETTVVVETEWFNTTFPTFKAYAGTRPTNPTELLYLVDRTPTADILPNDPNSYYGSFKPIEGTTHFKGVIDQLGVFLSNPDEFDGLLYLPGRVSSPLEGIWYIHAVVRNALGEAGERVDVAYGVDLTKPVRVENVRIYASNTAPTPATGWLSQSRVVVRWDGTERDALSGTEYYIVYIDGKPLSEWEGSDSEERIDFQRGRAVMSLTIEDLPIGLHTIEVTAVDHAGNESVKSAKAQIGVDVDTPKISIVAPTSGGTVGASPTFQVKTTDGAGISSVRYFVDGVPVGIATTAPYSKKVDLSLFSNGTHTLRVEAYDMVGAAPLPWTGIPHSAAATSSFKLDKTMPKLTNISGSPTLFYPRIRDGYRDNHTVRFTANKAGTVKLVVKNSSGKTVRTLSKSVGKGSGSVVWNGKHSDGSVHKGSYRYYLTLADAGGQSFKSGTYGATIRFTQVVRVGASRVKIVQR